MGQELARLVQRRRDELGLTRRDLAERSDISYPYLSQIESGLRDPSLRRLSQLAEALGLPVEALAGSVAPALPVVRAPLASREGGLDEKVLASVERKLLALEPLERLQVLAELTVRAAREAARS